MLYTTLSFSHNNEANYVQQAVADFLEEHGFTLKALNMNDVAGEAAEAPAIKAAVAKVALPYKVGQKLIANGDRLHDKVTVLAVWDQNSRIKPKYDRPNLPYPQVEVQPDSGGNPWHFDGNDIKAGKLIPVRK